MAPEKIWVLAKPHITMLGRWGAKPLDGGTEYIRKDVADAEKAELLEAANTLVLMHVAEQEGLRPPTPRQWMDAVDALYAAIAKARGEA